MSRQIRMGITMGDPSGIGPEIIRKSLRNFKQPRDCQIYVFGDQLVWQEDFPLQKIKLINLDKIRKSKFRQGVIAKEFGKASLAYLQKAVSFIKERKIDCLVTAPVSKQAINLSGYRFSGHTEFLASSFNNINVAMMFVSPKLKLSLVTRHMALKEVCRKLNPEMIFQTLSLTYQALKTYFRIRNPKLVVLGLNPHASEGGLMGKEEIRIIQPAIREFRKLNPFVFGPLAADTVFKRLLHKEFDAAICIYHDQALIPFKMLSFCDGVNLTLGLPFIRTSPVHGTAFELAGKNKADYNSMLEAIRLAYRLTRNRLSD